MIGTSGRSGTRQGFYNHKSGYELHFEVIESSTELAWVKTGNLDHYFANEDKRIDPEEFFSRSIAVVWMEVGGKFFESWKKNHYRRNTHNVVDKSEIDDIKKGRKGWSKAGFLASRFHRQGSEKELYHWKYVNKKDGREVILDNDDNLIEDSLNGATYNYGKVWYYHIHKDMLTYIIWGNTPDDPTSWYQRIYGTYHTR